MQHALWMSSSIGQDPYRWPRPDGFPETTATYASAARMVRSWQTHYALSGNWWKSSSLSRPSVAGSLPAAWPRRLDELVDHQSRILLGRVPEAGVVSTVSTMLGRKPDDRFTTVSEVSDWELTVIRGVLLNTPQGVLK
ncbi:MAG: DUF1800 family protein [Actinomycetales bacterium]|nr:MAG: DUF1800 family protein [Actinomycetales bacterium]